MKSSSQSFESVLEVIKRLRAPGGCPWDREQNPQSLRGNLIEEAYEAVEAINEKKPEHVKEELGDVFMLAIMLAYMHEQEGLFSVADTLDGLSEKLIRRHPHVFGDAKADDSGAVLKQWAEIKEKVEGRPKKDSILDEVSHALPPLERAYKIQKKAAKAGFDWDEAADVWAKTREELTEAETACKTESRDRLEEEMGDLLFSVVNASRFLGIDPMLALHRTVEKFCSRFKFVERGLRAEGLALDHSNFRRMDELWEKAKDIEGRSENDLHCQTPANSVS
jgi:tetrapyrrole methylase family protein / MazG family protein